MEHGIPLLKSKRGLMSRLARELGITKGAVSMWLQVPAERLPDVERITGIPRHKLRPDICIPPAEIAAFPAQSSEVA